MFVDEGSMMGDGILSEVMSVWYFQLIVAEDDW
jgi:hypothetical protein